jgi:hypothetical protein
MDVDCGCASPEVTPDWQKLKPALGDLLAGYPVQWNYHGYARLACLAKDRQATKAVMAKIEYPLADAWFGDNDHYGRCKAWAQGDDRKSGK